eukprot:CAMPEP_0181389224 /NCGR_PEP_ID=MMETSP1106-20121128/24784_1 /TAXON_ID=81844 /ORGANISM="Mantoniella antarctica, Strain SL-175" /LENGTH=110 /DNA_ID=CAMNT_0023509947 /DNA_START=218 /DNA_END=551 /DNA_ORIENTATION=+
MTHPATHTASDVIVAQECECVTTSSSEAGGKTHRDARRSPCCTSSNTLPKSSPSRISTGARGGGGVSGGGGGVRGWGGYGAGGGGGTGTASLVSAVGKKGRWGVITAPRF